MTKIKLVLSGSGVLYPVHVGAIQCLVQNGYEIEEVCGVSGGAIVAAAIASGYQPNAELVQLIKQTLPGKNDLIDVSLWSLFTQWGLIKGDKIEQMFERYFVKTLAEAKIPLKIAVTNVNRGTSEFLTSTSHPELSVSRAVRASMAIPFVFCPVKLGKDTFVDGGWVSNFPLDVFGGAANVVGLRFAASDKTHKKIASIKDYIPALINTSIEANMKEDIEDAGKARIVKLKTKHKNLNFGISDADVDEMIGEGFAAVDRALKAGKLRF